MGTLVVLLFGVCAPEQEAKRLQNYVAPFILHEPEGDLTWPREASE